MTSTYLGDTGIVLAGDSTEVLDAAGVKWTMSGEGPFSRSPGLREVSGDRATDDGSWDATEFYGPRTANLTGKAYAPDHTTLHQAEARFKAAVGLRCLVRHVEPGFDRQAMFRRAGEVLWTEITDTIAQFSAPLWAKDPRAYSSTLQTASTAFPSSTGGLTLPLTIPFSIDATTTGGGTLSLTNDGMATARPAFRIDGPVINPSILNDDTGQAMHLDLTIGAGLPVAEDLAGGGVDGDHHDHPRHRHRPGPRQRAARRAAARPVVGRLVLPRPGPQQPAVHRRLRRSRRPADRDVAIRVDLTIMITLEGDPHGN